MISFCSECSSWLLTLAYEPQFCSRCGSAIGCRIPILQYAVILAVAAVIWAIMN